MLSRGEAGEGGGRGGVVDAPHVHHLVEALLAFARVCAGRDLVTSKK